MEVLFENSTVRTKESIKELYRYLYFRRPLYIFVDVTMLLCLAATVFLHVTVGTGNYSVYFMVVLMLFLQVIMYLNSVKSQVNRDKEIFGEKTAQLEYTVTNDKIIYRCKNSETELEFSQIKKVYNTRNFLTLHSKANLAYTIGKNGFTVGSADDFIKLLKENGIKVK